MGVGQLGQGGRPGTDTKGPRTPWESDREQEGLATGGRHAAREPEKPPSSYRKLSHTREKCTCHPYLATLQLTDRVHNMSLRKSIVMPCEGLILPESMRFSACWSEVRAARDTDTRLCPLSQGALCPEAAL